MSKLIFSNDDIFNYYISLKTKPFVILMGLSGSGKTKLALRFAKAMTGKKPQYKLVPVEAGWIDNKSLLGYYNPITKTYTSTDFLDIILKAHQNYFSAMMQGKPNEIKPFFIILDEMNLSKVEYYFSKFLSILETMQLKTIECYIDESGLERLINEKKSMFLSEQITIHNEQGYVPKIREKVENSKRVGNVIKDLHGKERIITKKLKAEIKEYDEKQAPSTAIDKRYNHITGQFLDWHYNNNDIDKLKGNIEREYTFNDLNYIPPKISIPPNIYFTGTVNIDETTYMFSPKVLDRANSIELTEINVDVFKELILGVERDSEISDVSIQLKDVIKDFTYNFEFQLSPKIFKEKLKEYQKYIEDYFEVIKKIKKDIKEKAPNFNFGYRVINEMLLYIINFLTLKGVNEENYKISLDYQLKQKILAKIHGMKSELGDLFKELIKEDYKDFTRFQRKIERMQNELDTKQFTSYMQ